jgi:hypothetical protein
MHDPFQNYANMGSPYGAAPYQGSPYAAPYYNPLAASLGSSAINPATINGFPQAGQPGHGLNPVQGFLNPQQLQLAALLASQAGIPQFGISPQAVALQNPIVAALLANPLIAAGLHSQFGQQPQQFGQQPQSLYSQFGQVGGSPFGPAGPSAGVGYPLAPQSWVGQGGQLGGGQPYGQIHPLLAQVTARALQGQGFSPWGY